MLFRSDRKSTRLNSSHLVISYAVFCLKKKKKTQTFSNMTVPRAYTPDIDTEPPELLVVSSPVTCYDVSITSLFCLRFFFFFFFNDTATTEIYPLSLHDALPI